MFPSTKSKAMYKAIFLFLLFSCKFCFSQSKGVPDPIDFTDFFCIQPNTSINIGIYYEFRSVSTATVYPEQKKIDYVCIIDNKGFITLPPFFQSIQPADNPYLDSLKIKILDPTVPCGLKNCLTHTDLEKKLTEYFEKNIGRTGHLTMIQVKISPCALEFTNSITVYFKNKKYSMPYAEKYINQYFSDDLIRKQIGLKCKRTKFEVFSLCSKNSPACWSENGKFKKGYSYSPPLHKILPGDVIFLK